MRNWPALILLIAIAGASARKCSAVVIFVKGSDKPVMGFLVRQDDKSVTINQVLPDGQLRKRLLLRSEIDDVLLTVSRERLEKLDDTKPQDFRDYAEELSEKRQDPEARETAIRLYLISASMDPKKLGRSSMLGLISLARNENEESKFRAMAYLLDPEHDERVLKRPNPIKVEPKDITNEARLRLLSAVRSLRQGSKFSAQNVIKSPAAEGVFEHFSDVMTREEFDKACLASPLPSSALRKLITLEIMLLPNTGGVAETPKKDNPSSWQQSIRRDGTAPVPALTLETLTEFDPKATQFRNGKWVVAGGS